MESDDQIILFSKESEHLGTQTKRSFSSKALSVITVEPTIFFGTLGYGLSCIISQVNKYFIKTLHLNKMTLFSYFNVSLHEIFTYEK